MRPHLVPLCFLFLIAASIGAETLDVDEVIRRHVEARGGYDRLRALESVVYSQGTYSEPGYTGSGNAFMALRRPYLKVVGDPEHPGGFMEGYDGAAWEWFRDPGIVIRTVGPASGASRRGADLEGPLVNYRAKGSTVVLGEPATIGGRPTHRLTVTTRDGFVREYLLDQETYLIIAERRSAPFHAYGEPVTTETRIGDYREVQGVLFAFHYAETVIATGKILTEMHWGSIEVGRDLPDSWFSPPEFERTALQRFLEHLYVQRTDELAFLWTYHQFRHHHPEADTRSGVELIGYQFLKMGEVDQAISLLKANSGDYPDSASSAFGLGRAYAQSGRNAEAKKEFERALSLDPGYGRAAAALEELE